MRRIASLFATALILGLSGPAVAHTGGPVLDMQVQTGFGLTATFAQNAPACQTTIFHAGQYPADPLAVDSITCLDTSCDTREITLCPRTD